MNRYVSTLQRYQQALGNNDFDLSGRLSGELNGLAFALGAVGLASELPRYAEVA